MQKEKKVYYEQDDNGTVYEITLMPDGTKHERALAQEELNNFFIVPKTNPVELITRKIQEADIEPKAMTVEEPPQTIDDTFAREFNKYLLSGISFGVNSAIGALASPLFTPPILPYTAGIGLAGLGTAYALNPEGTSAFLKETGKEIIKPYVSPVESYKEDPFNTVGAYLPLAAIGVGLGKPLLTRLGEKILVNWQTRPASEQITGELIPDVKTMEAPLAELRDVGVDLTVPQTTGSPIGAATLMARPDFEEIINKQNVKIRRVMNKYLNMAAPPELRNHFEINQELGRIAELLRHHATEKYTEIMKSLKTTKSKIFKQYALKVPPIKIKGTDGKLYSISSPVELNNSIKAAQSLLNEDKKFLPGPTFFGDIPKKDIQLALDHIENILLKNPVAESSGKSWVNLQALDMYKRHLDRVLATMRSDNPSRQRISALRTAIEADIKDAMTKQGLEQMYSKYNEYAHKWLQLFTKTETGSKLPIKSEYQKVTSPTATVAKALTDVHEFDNLVELVGPKMATAALLQRLFTNSIMPNGEVNADLLISMISKNRDKFKYFDKELRTRLYNFAYGLKAQNRLRLKDTSAFQMKEGNAFIKFIGASIFGRTGIQVGTFTQALGFVISKSDLAKILMDPQAAWLAAKLTTTSVNSKDYASRMRAFLQALSRLGIYARVGDVIVEFTDRGTPKPVDEIN